MMYYMESPRTDPRFNLALEQYIFDQMDPRHSYFMLWRNHNTIVVGKHQNTMAEINASYVKDHDVRVVRRLSGGGAVYHDLGNVNFTVITDHEGANFDFSTFCRPVMAALASFGVEAQFSGRNDMTIQGRKFSGNSQYVKHGRVMHHGTIMYDSDLDAVQQALHVSKDKLVSKGLPSVRSRVTNVRPHMTQPVSTEEFMERLRVFMFTEYHLEQYELTEQDIYAIQCIQAEVYDRWEWNYGSSPACQIEKRRRIEGCGEIQIHIDVENGMIQALAFHGDYFGTRDAGELAQRLVGSQLEESSIRKAVKDVEVNEYFQNLDLDIFCSLLLL